MEKIFEITMKRAINFFDSAWCKLRRKSAKSARRFMLRKKEVIQRIYETLLYRASMRVTFA